MIIFITFNVNFFGENNINKLKYKFRKLKKYSKIIGPSKAGLNYSKLYNLLHNYKLLYNIKCIILLYKYNYSV